MRQPKIDSKVSRQKHHREVNGPDYVQLNHSEFPDKYCSLVHSLQDCIQDIGLFGCREQTQTE